MNKQKQITQSLNRCLPKIEQHLKKVREFYYELGDAEAAGTKAMENFIHDGNFSKDMTISLNIVLAFCSANNISPALIDKIAMKGKGLEVKMISHDEIFGDHKHALYKNPDIFNCLMHHGIVSVSKIAQ